MARKQNKSRGSSVVSKLLQFFWHQGGGGEIEDFYEIAGDFPGKRKLMLDTAYQLEKAGVLEEVSRKKKGKKIIKNFELTKKGMMRAVKLCMEKEKLKKLANERRLIIFDIPEKQRFYRDYFRQLMKDLGCRMVQLSVWQADFELPEDFLVLVGELGLQSRVIVYRVKPEEILYL